MERINGRPEPFEFYTSADLWTDEHTSAQMLSLHLNGAIDVSSRNAQFIDRSVEWIASRFTIGENTKSWTRRRCDRYRFLQAVHRICKGSRKQLIVNYLTADYLACALSPVQRKVILSKFHKILNPGGSVLLDVYSMRAFDQRKEASTYAEVRSTGFGSLDSYFCFQNTFRYEAEYVVLDKYTIVESTRTRTVFNWPQYFSPETLSREFIEGGFSIEELRADVAGAPYDPSASEFAVIARR